MIVKVPLVGQAMLVLWSVEIVEPTDMKQTDGQKGRYDRNSSILGQAHYYLRGMQQHWLDMDFDEDNHMVSDGSTER
jgi:hypothetical protein